MIKGRFFVILAFLSLAAACQSEPEAPQLLEGAHLQAIFDIPAQIEGQEPSHTEMNYLLYLPQGYHQDPDKRWPLIVFLHGSGDEDNDSAYVMSYGLPEVLHQGDQPQDFPFIVVSPQAFPNTPWWVGDTLAILNALVDQVVEEYRVDPERIYLTGLSMGGYGSWHLAAAYPDKFAAMVSISGSGFQTAPPSETSKTCQLQGLPVWAIHGAEDKISDPIGAKLYTAALSECNDAVEWTLYEDTGHFETYYRAYRDPALYAWLLEHSQ